MANKQILKSNSSYIIIEPSPSYTTAVSTSGGVLFSLVQNSNFSFSSSRQPLKQIGSQNYSVDALYKYPDIDLSIDYYFSPYLNNELLLGFSGSGVSDVNALSNFKDKNNNFYIFINKNDGEEGFKNRLVSPSNTASYNGYDCISFGNCYLSQYSLSIQNGQVPIVSTKFKCSNIQANKITTSLYTDSYIYSPALDPISGNTDTNGTQFFYKEAFKNSGYITGDIESRTVYNPPITVPYNSTFSFATTSGTTNNLRSFSGLILQSMDLNINFDRVDFSRIGANFVSDRKLQFPITAEISIQSLLSGFNTKDNLQIADYSFNDFTPFYGEPIYDLDFSFSNLAKSITGFYKFQNARLNSFSYSLPLNNIYTLSASFSVEITDSKGFKMSRRQK
jgi:hypothetical protein